MTRILLLFTLPICAIAADASSTAKTDDGKRWLNLWTAAQKVVVDPSDGISEVEAFKIAEQYFATKNGNLCGVVLIPKKEAGKWRVPLAEGIVPAPTKDVVIDAKTGEIRIEVIQKKAPNKAPEPTPLPVTIPAEPGIAPGSGVAHL